MDEGWIALALMFVGLVVILVACLYYMMMVMAEAPVDGRIGYGLAIAGGALFFAGGSIWRRGVPKE